MKYNINILKFAQEDTGSAGISFITPESAPAAAAESAPAATAPAPAPAPAATPTPSKGPALISNFISIRDMQKEIIEFAKAVSEYSSKGNEANEAKAKFNNFITEQYLARSPIKGVEWSKRQDLITRPQKSSEETALIQMDIVINSFNRIGRSKNEFVVDGIWGFRTNTALLNIYAFANSLIKLFKDFEAKNPYFGDNDLTMLGSNIFKDDEETKKASVTEKDKRAKVLAPLIKKLTTFYNSYVKEIAQHPGHIRYIEGAPMFTVTNQKDPAANKNPDLLKQIDNLYVGPLNLTSATGTVLLIDKLPLKVLSNKQLLKDFAGKSLLYAGNLLSDENLAKLLLEIKLQIKEKIDVGPHDIDQSSPYGSVRRVRRQ
jgi:hypothetical protein